MIDHALNEILRAHKANFPLRIQNAVIGMRKKGYPRDGSYAGREHRVIGFQLDGMDEIGEVELGAQPNDQYHYFDLIAVQRWLVIANSVRLVWRVEFRLFFRWRIESIHSYSAMYCAKPAVSTKED